MATGNRTSYARRDIGESTRDGGRVRRREGQPMIVKGALDDMEKRLDEWLAGGEKAVTAAGVRDESDGVTRSPFYRKKQDKVDECSLKSAIIRAMVDHLRSEGMIVVRKVDDAAWAEVVEGCEEDPV